MICYRCDCGFSGVTEGYDLNDVTCELCGCHGAEGKEELTNNQGELFLSDLAWAWRYMKMEPMNQNGSLKNACFGFKAGTPFTEIADWFVWELLDRASYDEPDPDVD